MLEPDAAGPAIQLLRCLDVDQVALYVADPFTILPDYEFRVGDSQDELVAQLRTEATNAAKADLALRAVADLEGVEVAEEEVDKEIEDIGRQRKISPAAVRRELENEDNLPAVRSGIRKTKALEWLIAHTEFVDEEGQVIDRSQLTPAAFESAEPESEGDAVVAEETE